MNKRTDCSAVCRSNEWMIGTTSTGGNLIQRVYRRMGSGDKVLYGVNNGRTLNIRNLSWQERDEIDRKMDDENLERGYAVRYFRRQYPSFIHLELTPKCRQMARDIYINEGEMALRLFLNRLHDRTSPSRDIPNVKTYLRNMDEVIEYVLNGRTKFSTPGYV